jgi:ubiquitin-conjugating enzyme E2 Z
MTDVSIKQNQRKIKRLQKDYKLAKQTKHENMWVDWEEDTLDKAFSIVVGPENTPYNGGFYMFDFDFESVNYPFAPPKIKFTTILLSTPQLKTFNSYQTHKTARMNPNLYENGFICLSLIGTWPKGDKWSSCYNIVSLSQHLKGILTDNPIQNEPGFRSEKIDSELATQYNFMLTHANLRIAVIDIIYNMPKKYEVFKPDIIKYFIDNFNSYVSICDEYEKHKWNKTIQFFSLFKWKEYIDFSLLKKKIYKLKEDIENGIVK